MSVEVKTVQLGVWEVGTWSVCCFHPLCSFQPQHVLKSVEALNFALSVNWFAGRAAEERKGGGERHCYWTK